MRKGNSGGKEERRAEKKRLMKIMATTSLPAVDRPNADRWNAARSCQKTKPVKTAKLYKTNRIIRPVAIEAEDHT